MFYKKQGLPDEGDIVICTIKKVLSHSIFVVLDEYDNLEGMIYISEVAPGRIRNIRDFVKEGKKIVCKVLNVKDKQHIDLSLRRVSTSVRIQKNQDYKQELKAEKLLEIVGKLLKLSLEDMYKEVGYKAIEEFGSLTNFFDEAIKDETIFEKLKIKDKISKELYKNIKDKIRIPKVEISGDIIIKSNAPEGIKIIKGSLLKNIGTGTKINYLSAPKYRIIIESSDYKKAESILKETIEHISNDLKKQDKNVEIDFKRNE